MQQNFMNANMPLANHEDEELYEDKMEYNDL